MKKSSIVARYGIIIALIVVAYFIDAMISQGLAVRTAVATIIITLTICQLFDLKQRFLPLRYSGYQVLSVHLCFLITHLLFLTTL